MAADVTFSDIGCFFLLSASVFKFLCLLTFIQMEGQKEIDILRLKLQEMNQLHGTTISDLQYLTTQYEDLLSEKVLSWTQSY